MKDVQEAEAAPQELKALEDGTLLDLLDDAYAALETGHRASAYQTLNIVCDELARRYGGSRS
jgi:hypothetical protein